MKNKQKYKLKVKNKDNIEVNCIKVDYDYTNEIFYYTLNIKSSKLDQKIFNRLSKDEFRILWANLRYELKIYLAENDKCDNNNAKLNIYNIILGVLRNFKSSCFDLNNLLQKPKINIFRRNKIESFFTFTFSVGKKISPITLNKGHYNMYRFISQVKDIQTVVASVLLFHNFGFSCRQITDSLYEKLYKFTTRKTIFSSVSDKIDVPDVILVLLIYFIFREIQQKATSLDTETLTIEDYFLMSFLLDHVELDEN